MRLIDADAIAYESIDSCDTERHEYYYGTCIIAVRKEDIDEMPTIQPEPHWIPVTENTLPEEGIPVNITWVNRNPEFYYSDIKDKPYTATMVYFHGKWFWYSCVIEDWLAEYGSNESLLANLQEAVDRDIEIVAWCELPEPFKGVTE